MLRLLRAGGLYELAPLCRLAKALRVVAVAEERHGFRVLLSFGVATGKQPELAKARLPANLHFWLESQPAGSSDADHR
jgi:hypothetical protein